MIARVALSSGTRMGQGFDFEDLEDTPEDGRGYEVLDGVLVVSPAPPPLHQRVVGRLYGILSDAAPPGMEVFTAPLAWWITTGQVPEPDVMVVRDSAVGERAIMAAPALVVEVLSAWGRRRDTHDKRDLYAAGGCPCYWIVDPDEPSLTVLALSGQQYEDLVRVVGGEAYEAAEPFRVRVVPIDLVRQR